MHSVLEPLAVYVLYNNEWHIHTHSLRTGKVIYYARPGCRMNTLFMVSFCKINYIFLQHKKLSSFKCIKCLEFIGQLKMKTYTIYTTYAETRVTFLLKSYKNSISFPPVAIIKYPLK